MATSLRRSSRILAVSTAAKLVASATKPIRLSLHITSPSADTFKRPAKRARSEDLEDVIAAYAEDYAPKKAKSPRKANTAKEPKVKKSKVVVYNLDEFPARGSSPWKIGPHVSAAGGVENAVLNAASIGCVSLPFLFHRSIPRHDSLHSLHLHLHIDHVLRINLQNSVFQVTSKTDMHLAQCNRIRPICEVSTQVDIFSAHSGVNRYIQESHARVWIRCEARLTSWKLSGESREPRRVRMINLAQTLQQH